MEDDRSRPFLIQKFVLSSKYENMALVKWEKLFIPLFFFFLVTPNIRNSTYLNNCNKS